MDSIPRIRRELIGRFEGLVRTRARALGIGLDEFGGWVNGVVGEGIAIAIAEQNKWDPEKGDFLHWAFLKTRSLIKRELKQRERYRRAIEACKLDIRETGVPLPEHHFLVREELVEILMQLTLNQQKALVLYYLNGMTVATLSEILGKPPKTVYSLLDRARSKARTLSLQKPTPSYQDTSEKKFPDSVRNSDLRGYTYSEGAGNDDVFFR